METTQLKKIIEAALLAASQPMTVPQLEALFADGDTTPIGHRDIAQALESLAEDCAERGIELVEVASGFRYQVRREVHPWVARMWTERPSRYSRALLETLALIAYRQPITRGEIEQVRGVAVSSNIIKTLEEREWIRVVGHRDTPGRPALFSTTRSFLDYFNLKALDELPPLADIINLEALDPQLTLRGNDAQDGTDDHAVPPPDEADSDTDAQEADGDASAGHDTDPDNETPGENATETETRTVDPQQHAADDDSDAPSPAAAESGPTETDADADSADTAIDPPEHPEENRA